MRVAILPAGGPAIRMANYYPVPKQLLPLNHGVVIDYALEVTRYCGAWPHLIVPTGDERIARYVDSKNPHTSFSYSLSGPVAGLLADIYSLREVFGDAQTLYVMTDMVIDPLNIGEAMLMKLDFPLVVGVYITSTPQKLGMCVLGDRKESEPLPRIIRVEDKPTEWDLLPAAWGLLAWRDEFWDCLAQEVEADNMTEVIARAIELFGPLPIAWLNECIDIGSPEDYERARREGW